MIPPFWMMRTVPGSRTLTELSCWPIFATLYWALSCSVRETVCAVCAAAAHDGRNSATRNAAIWARSLLNGFIGSPPLLTFHSNERLNRRFRERENRRERAQLSRGLLSERLLLDLFLGLVGFLLLSFNLLHCDGGVGRRRRNFTGYSADAGGGRKTCLALLLRQRFQTAVHLFAELVMHFLEIRNLNSRRRTQAAVRLLAADNADAYGIGSVRNILGACQNVARA